MVRWIENTEVHKTVAKIHENVSNMEPDNVLMEYVRNFSGKSIYFW